MNQERSGLYCQNQAQFQVDAPISREKYTARQINEN